MNGATKKVSEKEKQKETKTILAHEPTAKEFLDSLSVEQRDDVLSSICDRKGVRI
jgi:F0F1-type ATP synthase delta subunit